MKPRAPDLVVVGASWGGIDVITRLLADLRPDFLPPIAIVLHRAPDSPSGTLVRYLAARCPLPVSEIDDKDPIGPAHVYLAPPDYHVLVEPDSFALSLEAPVHHSRPSIDVLFESAADAYGSGVVAVILTGANDDGAAGIRAVKAAGGRTLAQDPATAERATMPAAAIATGAVDAVLGVEEIASELNAMRAGDGPRS